MAQGALANRREIESTRRSSRSKERTIERLAATPSVLARLPFEFSAG